MGMGLHDNTGARLRGKAKLSGCEATWRHRTLPRLGGGTTTGVEPCGDTEARQRAKADPSGCGTMWCQRPRLD
jgi:hypothetical protein